MSYPNQTSKINFSKTTRQKLKTKSYSCRVILALLEYTFTFNFCRVVFEKLVFKVLLGIRYGDKFGESAVR